jgi:hypothetical protein
VAAVAHPLVTHIDAGGRWWRIAWRAAYVVARRWGRVMRLLAAAGVPTFEYQFIELDLVGRRTGRPRPVILTLIRVEDSWYVGHPNGPRSWLSNLAAAGSVEATVLGMPAVRVRPVALGLGPERDAVIRATAWQQPFGARGWYQAAQAHILRAGIYYRLERD